MVAEFPVSIAHGPDDEGQVDVHLHQLEAGGGGRVRRTYLELWRRVQLPVEDHPPDPAEGDQDDVVEEVEDGEDGEDAEPEPEEDVDLLVDDVDGEDALDVVALDGAAGPVLVEGALGHPWKDLGHTTVK